ncbi:metallophosphatase domain-containing protein [Pedobacter puniceum]|uniref:Metallophosphoesterase n=1 Tax=Pedobacter puniceum TaxID=2666136 RepID=A0A7K0FR94_9SPHI|nr:metallophosphoesterase [Pedobacter puniceum]MRX48262.1 metallophosphoesterase [Pedobacter puniceum]
MPAFTILSDTHNLHHKLKLCGGDFLIHCGDVTEYGTEDELEDFIYWFTKQNYTHKIFIAGNHDLCLENISKKQKKAIIPPNITYLENKGININGINIYGSPVTPYYLGMAFNRKRGDEIRKIWNKIPLNTDILITHTPPFTIMDNKLGCEDLLKTLQKVKPKLAVFGHIHEHYGTQEKNGTAYINAAITSNITGSHQPYYKLLHPPVDILI